MVENKREVQKRASNRGGLKDSTNVGKNRERRVKRKVETVYRRI